MDVRKYEIYFECQLGYLCTSEQSERVTYPVQHENNFIFRNIHLLFCLLYYI